MRIDRINEKNYRCVVSIDEIDTFTIEDFMKNQNKMETLTQNIVTEIANKYNIAPPLKCDIKCRGHNKFMEFIFTISSAFEDEEFLDYLRENNPEIVSQMEELKNRKSFLDMLSDLANMYESVYGENQEVEDNYNDNYDDESDYDDSEDEIAYIPLVTIFDNLDDIIKFSHAFANKFNQKNSLYKMDGKYCLIIYYSSVEENLYCSMNLCEFGTIVKDSGRDAYIIEHGELIRENCLEILRKI